MKKGIITLCLLICVFALVSCSSSEDALHLGVNAVITEVDVSSKTIAVKDSGEEGVLGEQCLIDCVNIPIIYCDYDTGEVKRISFEDLQVGDEVLLSIRSSQIASLQDENGKDKKIQIEQLQLGTQRIK